MKPTRKKYKDFEVTFRINKLDELPDINVGQKMTITQVNRQTGEITMNHYTYEDYEAAVLWWETRE